MNRSAFAQTLGGRRFGFKIGLISLVMVTLLSGCGGESADTPNSEFLSNALTRNRSQPLGTGVSGRVISAVGGAAISGATISSGSVTAASTSDGFYNLGVPAGDRMVVTFSAPGYASTIKVVSVINNRSTSLSPQLIPVGATQSVNIASGGTVSVTGSQAQVVIPAACLVRTDGGAAAANASIEITPIAPGTDANFMSGEYIADASGVLNPIESFGALLITAHDASGASYTLGTGCTASIRIPVGTRGTAPGSSPLFYLQESSGRWIQSGTGTLTGSAPNQYFAGTIDRLGYWNADQIMTTVNVTGCINDQITGQPIANALVTADGINYSSLNTIRTAQDGTFTLPIRQNSTATVFGLTGTSLTNTVVVGPSASNIALTPCLLGTTENFGFNVRLTWGASPSDIDTHLLTPNGVHIDYTNKGLLSGTPFAALDVDDTTGFGPEVLSVQRLYVGTYRYFLHNYSGTFSPGMTGSPTRVELNFGNSLDVFTPPSGEGSNEYWHIFDIQVDAQCVVTLVPVNQWRTTEPASITSTSPAICAG